jgi:Hsp70 protein
MPTCVAFTKNEILIGTAAKQQAADNLQNTFCGFTCLLGKVCSSWSDDELDYKWYECDGLRKRDTELSIFVPCRKRHYTLVQLTGLLIESCQRLAQAHCQGDPGSFNVAISSNSVTTKAVAEAAEIAGIQSPTIVSSEVALAWSFAAQQHFGPSLNKASIMIIEAGTRGYRVAAVDTLASPPELSQVSVESWWRTNFGSSIDQIYAHQQVHQPYQVMPYVKQISILIEAVRRDLIKTRERYRYIPVLGNNKDFVLMSARVDLSLIVSPRYLESLRDRLDVFGQGKRMPHRCILTGEASCLESVQSLVQNFLAGSRCRLILTTTDGAISASKGAADLAFRNIAIHETLPRQLELLLCADEGKDLFVELSPGLERGQDLGPSVKSARLSPASSVQTGLLVAVYETDVSYGSDSSRELLFEIAIQPYAIRKSYSLEISVDRNFNVDFELRHSSHGPEYVVDAHVHCSNTGVIDLREGDFVAVDDFARRNWRLKTATTEVRPCDHDTPPEPTM